MKYTKVVLSPVRRQQINKIGFVIKVRAIIFFLFIHYTIVVRIAMLLTLSCCSHLVLHTPSHRFLHLGTSSLRLCTYGIFDLSMHCLRKANCLIVVNRLKIFIVHLLNQVDMMLFRLDIIFTISTVCLTVFIGNSSITVNYVSSCPSTHVTSSSLLLLDSWSNICI